MLLVFVDKQGLDGKVSRRGKRFVPAKRDRSILLVLLLLLLLGEIEEWRNSEVEGEKATFFDGRSVTGC